ncbi:MAG TPA: DUF4397 domain-containing protein, partial [Gemmatimonadales bacterium]|nr:DUF4397 domain-containing protein [Gemmatimonadales bacterium]
MVPVGSMEVSMQLRVAVAVAGLALFGLGCAKKDATGPQKEGTSPQLNAGVRVVNAYSQAVDVLVDGAVAVASVAPGSLDTVLQSAGNHTVALRAAGVTTSGLQVKTAEGSVVTVAALRWGAALAASTLDDTNAVVPSGATKVRVLHLAPNAGEIQVARTQPDWLSPPLIGWKIPFLYDSVHIGDPLANPFYQSTVGPWDVRVWRTPSEDALGWDGATARVSFTLASGEKRTVLVLDKPGGGIELSV